MKITAPWPPNDLVGRPALCAELDAGDPTAVRLVCAPAGYGKTLLLADWVRRGGTADTVWVSLDRDDNDPRRLWASVLAALVSSGVVPRSRAQTPTTWAAGSQPDFIADLVELLRMVPRPTRLILDDVHELTDPDALHSLESFMRNRPGHVQLVLASRHDPPLGLPRLRLSGGLRELRADRMRFTRAETAALLGNAGLRLTAAQVQLLHDRTGGWAAGLRLAALAMSDGADPDDFLPQFSGDERSVADYLAGEVLTQLPDDTQEFLRSVSICDSVPATLAAELSGRPDAGSVLDALERRTSLITHTGQERDAYQVQPLLRTYLAADLRRRGAERSRRQHATAARWWAGQDQPIRTLDHARRSGDAELLSELLHRFAVPLILNGDHRPLRRALTALGTEATATDPLLALTSALTNLETGEVPAARSDLLHARRSWPVDESADLRLLRTVVEQLGAAPAGEAPRWPVPVARATELPIEPEMEALTRLSRATANLSQAHQHDDTWAELESTLDLARRNGFDYLTMQCLAMLAILAANDGDLRAMRELSAQALDSATGRDWETSPWSAAAMAMLAYAAVQRAEPDEAERLAASALTTRHTETSPQLRLALRSVHGAAVHDRGDRIRGLAQMQQARTEFGDETTGAEQIAATAMLEFRAALTLGHNTAARTVRGWLADRTGGESAELALMRAWTEAAAGHDRHARTLVHPVLEDTVPAVLPTTAVEAWLLEAALAVTIGERPAARRALHTALTLAEPIDALRPFAQAGSGIRELLVHQHGSFGASNSFAERALRVVAGAAAVRSTRSLSERELTVLALLPSLLSLDEIATDLTVSVNTVKSHVRSIYTKLGVSSRRAAVLAAHEHGLLATGPRPG